MDIIENVSGEGVVSRRVHHNEVDNTASDEYYIKNHLGSTVTLLDKDGEITGQVIDYYAYGKQKVEVQTPSSRVTQTFTGKELDLFEKDSPEGDDGEGLYYFGVRYYDADVGYFTSTDPKEEFWNLYAYGPANPIGGIDPDGEGWIGSTSLYGGPMTPLNWFPGFPGKGGNWYSLRHDQVFFDESQTIAGKEWKSIGIFAADANILKTDAILKDDIANVDKYTFIKYVPDDVLVANILANGDPGDYEILADNCQLFAKKAAGDYVNDDISSAPSDNTRVEIPTKD